MMAQPPSPAPAVDGPDQGAAAKMAAPDDEAVSVTVARPDGVAAACRGSATSQRNPLPSAHGHAARCAGCAPAAWARCCRDAVLSEQFQAAAQLTCGIFIVSLFAFVE